MTRGPRRLLLLTAVVVAPLLLTACGEEDDEQADSPGPSLSVITDASDPNFDEPEIPPEATLCSDVRVGSRFVAFRVIAHGVLCDEAEAVAKAVASGTPPDGWSCEEIQGTLVECRDGEALVAFNSA